MSQTHLTSNEQQTLRQLYLTQLRIGNNKITHEGLYSLLVLSGIPANQQQIPRIYSLIDTDNNGFIQQSQFLKYMQLLKGQMSVKEELERMFDGMAGPKGMTREVFKNFILSVCNGMEVTEAEILAQEVDSDMDGFVKKEEFMYMFTEYGKKEEKGK